MTNLSRPVIPIDFPIYANEEQAPFTACGECLPWSLEVILDHPNGGVWVREWHAEDCPHLRRLERVRTGGDL